MNDGDRGAGTLPRISHLGNRVRLWTKKNYRYRGVVVEETDDYIVLNEEVRDTRMQFSRDWITQIELLNPVERK